MAPSTSQESTPSTPSRSATCAPRPELHITAETGVLEAPAGAIITGGEIHVFHQFRPTPSEGARWAHQIASEDPYAWDIRDDVLAPADGELDILAGSAIRVAEPACPDDGAKNIELFFVVATPSPEAGDEPVGDVPHGSRGPRRFEIHRACVADLDGCPDISDDPKATDPGVTRLGPIEVDPAGHRVDNLVTPSVLASGDGWRMLALSLIGETDAQIALLTSRDRQHWRMEGVLELPPEARVPEGRPYAPRLAHMTDSADGQDYDVLFITYPVEHPGGDGDATPTEVAGYIVGHLDGTRFEVTTPFTPLDYGHDFTRPRVIQASTPVMFGLVGSHPSLEGHWANCLTAPRFLSLCEGVMFQDIIGAPGAIAGYSDRAILYTAQLEAGSGSVEVRLLDGDEETIATVSYSGDAVCVTRDDGDRRVAPLGGADSDTLAVFVDGPVCEVFADGGAVTLTSALRCGVRTTEASTPARGTSAMRFEVAVTGDAKVLTSMVTAGQHIQRTQAGLTSPAAHDELLAQARTAEIDLASLDFSLDAD